MEFKTDFYDPLSIERFRKLKKQIFSVLKMNNAFLIIELIIFETQIFSLFFLY